MHHIGQVSIIMWFSFTRSSPFVHSTGYSFLGSFAMLSDRTKALQQHIKLALEQQSIHNVVEIILLDTVQSYLPDFNSSVES